MLGLITAFLHRTPQISLYFFKYQYLKYSNLDILNTNFIFFKFTLMSRFFYIKKI